jgi:uncharacterized protein YndB with AHSA1/START domain
MELKFTVQTKIQKPVHEVFDAVYNPKKLSVYFTSGGSDGPLDEGKTVMWTMHDDPHPPHTFPVKVQKTVKDKLIRFTWAASEGTYDAKTGELPHPGGYDNTVEISFEPLDKDETLVRITEGGWRESQAGLQGSYGNCQGWMHMSCCLKAYIEHGINLRKGSF